MTTKSGITSTSIADLNAADVETAAEQATADAFAAEQAAVQANEDVDRARLDALDKARAVAAARQAEADQAAAELRQREQDWQDTLARQAAEREAERLAVERERIAGIRAEIVAERDALEEELPGLLQRVLVLAHEFARWETRRADLRGQPNWLVQTAVQTLGDASSVALPAFGIETESFGAMAGHHEVPLVAQAAITALFRAAQGTKPPAEG
ncbi:hypothetical protein I6A60_00530 [Frankia sp. AgB1.9]|uniref:hypothetical protein n=1 Tax=unclassified Frankia TaxID=2632575 RepID=UPI001931C2C4|nr:MULTISPECIES: hypothetical protein [unclassified Frankia]MBL7487366.1 hypothetical protein [Frankia sp. AgW1.1]MBL7546374.1 hypothetical protein [Frankia sp. AgB1.9]MBL7618581.1 hypothetical protein [Frankia sp. AgB1.8]